MTAPIRYLKRSEIDEDRWDECISSASNGLIYGYSFYLDAMADNWDALVLHNYQAVMPLPWRKKWGICYLYQPFLTAQLGLFGNDVSCELFKDFLQQVPAHFQYWDVSFNYHNRCSVPGFTLRERKNYVLPLNNNYNRLYARYRENIRRNIKRASTYKCAVKKQVGVEEVISLALGHPQPGSQTDFNKFKKLFSLLDEKQMVATYGIVGADGALLASAVFFYSHNRAYYILVGNHPNGRTLGASHALIDAFITDHAGKNIKLDFEGSDIGNLAFFYSSFGAVEENYPSIHENRLPFWARWFKK